MRLSSPLSARLRAGVRGEGGSLLLPSPLGGEGLGVRGKHSGASPPSPPAPLPRPAAIITRGEGRKTPHPQPLSPEGRGEQESPQPLSSHARRGEGGKYQDIAHEFHDPENPR